MGNKTLDCSWALYKRLNRNILRNENHNLALEVPNTRKEAENNERGACMYPCVMIAGYKKTELDEGISETVLTNLIPLKIRSC